jgi:hypothetical protein
VVGFTTGSRGKVPGYTCEKRIIIIIITIIIINTHFKDMNLKQ